MTLTFNYRRADMQKLKFKVSPVQKMEWKQMDEQTDRQTDGRTDGRHR